MEFFGGHRKKRKLLDALTCYLKVEASKTVGETMEFIALCNFGMLQKHGYVLCKIRRNIFVPKCGYFGL